MCVVYNHPLDSECMNSNHSFHGALYSILPQNDMNQYSIILPDYQPQTTQKYMVEVYNDDHYHIIRIQYACTCTYFTCHLYILAT